jgi:hypothetical protein
MFATSEYPLPEEKRKKNDPQIVRREEASAADLCGQPVLPGDLREPYFI